MAFTIEINQLSPTMKEGVLVEWLKEEGDFITPGDAIAAIETDKAIMDLESFEEGILLSKVAEVSARLPIGTPIGVIGEVNEDITKLVEEIKSRLNSINLDSKIDDATPANQKEETMAPQKLDTISSSISVKKEDTGKIKASPLAKNLASKWKISLDSINGSGPNGRIVKKDVEAARIQQDSSYSSPSENRVQDQRISLSMMRQSIAQRLTESKSLVPHFYLTKKINLGALNLLRKEINADLLIYHERDQVNSLIRPAKLSFNDFIIRANALALKEHPHVNSQWDNNGIIIKGNVDIGVAVAIEDGLITPVIRNVPQKNIFQIALEIKSLAQKARNRKLSTQEFTGGTFTISNLGMYNIDSFIAILNPPEAALMAVGKGVIEPFFDPLKKEFVPQNIMSVTLSCDHRVIDGAKGAEYLQTFSFFMEHPRLLI